MSTGTPPGPRPGDEEVTVSATGDAEKTPSMRCCQTREPSLASTTVTAPTSVAMYTSPS